MLNEYLLWKIINGRRSNLLLVQGHYHTTPGSSIWLQVYVSGTACIYELCSLSGQWPWTLTLRHHFRLYYTLYRYFCWKIIGREISWGIRLWFCYRTKKYFQTCSWNEQIYHIIACLSLKIRSLLCYLL